jgi:hypothetical protein
VEGAFTHSNSLPREDVLHGVLCLLRFLLCGAAVALAIQELSCQKDEKYRHGLKNCRHASNWQMNYKVAHMNCV